MRSNVDGYTHTVETIQRFLSRFLIGMANEIRCSWKWLSCFFKINNQNNRNLTLKILPLILHSLCMSIISEIWISIFLNFYNKTYRSQVNEVIDWFASKSKPIFLAFFYVSTAVHNKCKFKNPDESVILFLNSLLYFHWFPWTMAR